MYAPTRFAALALTLAALSLTGVGCPEDAPTTTADTAAAPDATTDATATGDGTGTTDGTALPDAVADATPDGNAPDVAADTTDTASPDAAGPDATVDATPDAIADTSNPDAAEDAVGPPDAAQDATTTDLPVADGSAGDSTSSTVGDPFAPGPNTVVTSTDSVSVPGGLLGPTTVNLTIYAPDGDGPHPLILFSHGFNLGPSDYASYGDHLASWGFIVVFPSAGGFAPRTHLELKDDLIAVMDWAETNLSLTSIGLTGHSLGGKTSIFAAAEDMRPVAVFGIDPVDSAPPFTFDPTGYPSVTPELVGNVAAPMVLLGETTNGAAGVGGQACAPSDDNFEQFFMHAAAPALKIDVLGAFHMSFLDNPSCLSCLLCPAGTDDPAQTLALTRGYVTAFFLVELQGEAGYQTYLTGAEMQDDVSAGLVTTETANGYP